MRSALARFLFAVALAATASGAYAQGSDAGFFLVAKPSITDPNFARAVILVTTAPDGATLGVILNRPTRQSLAGILPELPELARFTDPLYFGGPVERIGLYALFRSPEPIGQALAVIDDVYLALHPETVEDLLHEPPAQMRLFVGYSGWAPRQLERELERGDWWVVPADAATIFRRDTDALWEELARRARAVTAKLAKPGEALISGIYKGACPACPLVHASATVR